MIEVYYIHEFRTFALLYKKNNVCKWSDGYYNGSIRPNEWWILPDNLDLSSKLFEIME